MNDACFYIDGRAVTTASASYVDNVNPATGEVIGRVPIATKADVDEAVAAARLALDSWRRTPATQRGRILMAAARLLRERNGELARLEVLDTGKPISEALAVDIHSGADAIEYFAGVAPTLHGSHIQLGASFGYTRREPLGVCGGIGAWNYPMQIACWKSAPALACGNTMVFKPAHLTPMTALKLAEIYTEAGLPDGVFNVVHGLGPTGAALTEHPGIDKISLTGSVGTGKKVMEAAAKTLKKVTMELGGKSPLIVFSDADLDNAVSAAIMANFYTQGEVCSNGTRVFVAEEILERFIERLLMRVRCMTVGDPLDPGTHVGALISEDHMMKVLGYIDTGIRGGARLLHGGKRVGTRGYFVEPTVFADCHDDMTICREEIFGPVMSILAFRDEPEVIRRANDTSFGLSAAVFTRDIQRAHRVIAAIDAGTCWINNYNLTPVELPFGGNRQSGIGRENGLAAIESYTQLKSVYVEAGDVAAPY